MIVKKTWKTMGDSTFFYKYLWTGYFLFGLIPVYLKRELI